jgi:hypothetical protein
MGGVETYLHSLLTSAKLVEGGGWPASHSSRLEKEFRVPIGHAGCASDMVWARREGESIVCPCQESNLDSSPLAQSLYPVQPYSVLFFTE